MSMKRETFAVLDCLGAGEGDLFFPARGRAEANFQVLLSTYIDYVRETGRTQLLAPEDDHCSILEGIKRLEKLEVSGKSVALNQYGQVTRDAVEAVLRPRTAMLSLSWADELTGVIQPIFDIAALCQEKGVRLHVDATSIVGKLYFHFADMGIDFLTLNEGTLVRKGAILSPLYFEECPQKADLKLLQKQVEKTDQMCLEIARLRDMLEAELVRLIPGCQIIFQEADRLPNCSAFAIPGIYGETLLSQLQKRKVEVTTGGGRLCQRLLACGVDPLIAHSAVSLALSLETSEEDILRLLRAIADSAFKPRAPSKEEAAQKGMRLAIGQSGSVKEGRAATCYLFVDESDGAIADCKFDIFGPAEMHLPAEAAARLVLRKTYVYAQRLSAEIVEKAMKGKSYFVNYILDAVDDAASQCMDIPIDEMHVAPQAMAVEVAADSEYPHWNEASNEEKRAIVEEVIARDIRPYIELDAGGIEIFKIEHPNIHISYKGACTTCHSSTGATLDAIQNILRTKIAAELAVIPEL